MAGKQIIYKGFPFQIIIGKPFFPLENLRDALVSLTVSEPYRFRKSLGKGAPEGSEHFSLPIFSGDF